ncbi:izumo sperm-egg fusion protein 4 isoform X1 [Nannospalax galili]|uniref:izumo sperm-egg fusion protein 4 isoform X1 n=1 Tax=Nannospalax galili TaxID=1026970 RepID=UPI00111C91ED|nr:izumo sperm-egg fusion protein 4 isoform X1 [Nannospalax galili]
MGSRGRRGGALGLLLYLGLTAELAGGCLHCDPNFSEKFCYYRHHVNLKSWWVGDIPVSGMLLTEWSQNTMKELHLAIPAEITREKLDQVAGAVYQRMDQLYQGKIYFPGYFPNELRAIFREQVRLIQNAIIESRIDCQHHCGKLSSSTAKGQQQGPRPESQEIPWLPLVLQASSSMVPFLAPTAPTHMLSASVITVISTVGDSCTGPPELHKCLAPTGHTDEKHPSLPITEHQVSGPTASDQPDLGTRLRVSDPALMVATCPQPGWGPGLNWTSSLSLHKRLAAACLRSPPHPHRALAGKGGE